MFRWGLLFVAFFRVFLRTLLRGCLNNAMAKSAGLIVGFGVIVLVFGCVFMSNACCLQ